VTALDAADLVVIAGRTLGIGTDDALARMDIGAAQDALAEARPAGQSAGQAHSTGFPDRAAAAAAAVGLVRALLRHRPFPEHGQQVAVAAGLQFLSLNGWRADLNPAGAAAVVVEALASGRLTPHDAAAWLSPRLSPVRRAGQAPITVPRPSLRLPVSLPTVRVPVVRVPVGRAVAGALLAVAVTGVSLLAAACSRGPAMLPSHAAPARAGSVSAVQQSSGSRMAPGLRAVLPADMAYAACIRSHGVESFPSPSAGGVTVIAPAAGIDLNSPRFRSAESVCRVTVPTQK
jgi:prophage maintenance system killer protein